MMQPEEKIRRYFRLIDGMLEGLALGGLPLDVILMTQHTTLRWILGMCTDPPNLDEGKVMELEERVAKLRSELR